MSKVIPCAAVIWDYNGTIVDDPVHCWRTSCAVIRAFGGRPMSFIAMRRMFSQESATWLGFYRARGVRADERSIAEAYYRVCGRFRERVELVPGARETIERLHAAGFEFGIVSGFWKDVILEELARFGLGRFFLPQRVIAADSRVSIDKREMFAALLGSMRVRCQDAVTVGDMPFEMRAARESGMHAVGFLGGLGTRRTLVGAGAERCIRDLATLPTMLRRGCYDVID